MRVLTDEGDGFWGHRDPAWSPDGRTLCYADFKNLWLVPADGGEARQLTDDDDVDFHPVWSPDGEYIIFSSFREGTSALWTIRVSDGSMHRLTAGTSEEDEPSFSRSGQRLAYSTTDDNTDIVIVDRETGSLSKISGATEELTPAVAPDGSTIAFVSDRRGGYDLWLQPLHGGAPDGPPRRLTEHRGSVAVPAFSHDGKWLASGSEDSVVRLWPLAGEVPAEGRIVSRAEGMVTTLASAPDGSSGTIAG